MIDVKLEFHHIGVACKSIEKSIICFEKLGYQQETDFFEDEIQGIRGVFLLGAGPRIELLENLNNSETLTELAKNGDNFYHLAYRVRDVNFNLEEFIKHNKYLLIKSPVYSIFFQTKICFLMDRNKMIIELIGDI